MARFSEKHFKDNPTTPLTKSDRFKKLLTRRPSSSRSVSNSKSPLVGSPVSPSVKPGFQQIGLLPYERTSLEAAKRLLDANGGKLVKEAIENDLNSLRDVQVRHRVDTGLNLSGDFHVERHSRSPPSTEGPTTTNAQSLASTMSIGNENFEEAVTSQPSNHDNAFLGFDGEYSHSEPSVSSIRRILEAGPPPNQEVCKHGEALLAQMLAEQSQAEKSQNAKARERKANSDSTVISTNSSSLKFTGMSNGINLLVKLKSFDLFAAPKFLGSHQIKNAHVVGVQTAVMIAYLLFVLISAFVGPKTLLLTIWRMGVVISTYILTLQYKGFEFNPKSDVFVAPVLFVLCRALITALKIFNQIPPTIELEFTETLKKTMRSLRHKKRDEANSE